MNQGLYVNSEAPDDSIAARRIQYISTDCALSEGIIYIIRRRPVVGLGRSFYSFIARQLLWLRRQHGWLAAGAASRSCCTVPRMTDRANKQNSRRPPVGNPPVTIYPTPLQHNSSVLKQNLKIFPSPVRKFIIANISDPPIGLSCSAYGAITFFRKRFRPGKICPEKITSGWDDVVDWRIGGHQQDDV